MTRWSSRTNLLSAIAAVFALSLFFILGRAIAITLPAGFVSENAFPSLSFELPVQVVFLPDGRKLVVELEGRVWTLLPSGEKWPTPFLDLTEEVRSHHDLGMIGCAIDPDFPEAPWVYLSYVAEPSDTTFQLDQFSRLTRYRFDAANPNVADLSSRQVLIGETWAEGIPALGLSHSIGTIRFGADKSLLVASGDGGQFTHADSGGVDPEAFHPGRSDPSEDIGSFRARSIDSMAGKILRIDKETGRGLPSNPYWNGNPLSDRSRVWAYGLRNPYRFCVRPGTGSADPDDAAPGVLYLGDVGWDSFEEFLIIPRGGMNFGWPCFEGSRTQLKYDRVRSTAAGNDSILCNGGSNAENPAPVTFPTLWWHHTAGDESFPIGWIGSTAVGGVFYTGDAYPEAYRGRYFIADHVQGWIRTIEVDAQDRILGWGDFASDAEGPVDLEVDPSTGDIYYVSIFAQEIRRLRYQEPPDSSEAEIAAMETRCHPNPFRHSVTIELEIGNETDLAIDLYSADGRLLCALADGHYAAGVHTFEWDGSAGGRRVPRGIYFYRVRAGGREECRKLTME